MTRGLQIVLLSLFITAGSCLAKRVNKSTQINDYQAEEQRLAVQIITSDLQTGSGAEEAANGSLMARAASGEGQASPEVSFDDQYELLSSQLAGGGGGSLQLPVGSKRIVINLKRANGSSELGTGSGDTRLTIGFAPPPPLPVQDRQPEAAGQQQQVPIRRSFQQAVRASTARPQPLAPRERRMREALFRGLHREGGVPALVVEQEPAGGGEPVLGKLMLGSEAVEQMRREARVSEKAAGEELKNWRGNNNKVEGKKSNFDQGDNKKSTTTARRRSSHKFEPKNNNGNHQGPITLANLEKSRESFQMSLDSNGIADMSDLNSNTTPENNKKERRRRRGNGRKSAAEQEQQVAERVARLMEQLKLYTTKEQLMRVARELESVGGGGDSRPTFDESEIAADKKAGGQNELLGGNLHSLLTPNQMPDSNAAVELTREQTELALARNRVPAPINLPEQLDTSASQSLSIGEEEDAGQVLGRFRERQSDLRDRLGESPGDLNSPPELEQEEEVGSATGSGRNAEDEYTSNSDLIGVMDNSERLYNEPEEEELEEPEVDKLQLARNAAVGEADEEIRAMEQIIDELVERERAEQAGKRQPEGGQS